MRKLKEAEDFINLLLNHENWLLKRILHYARQNNYIKYTPSLRETWRLSIKGITESFAMSVKSHGLNPQESFADKDCGRDPLSYFGQMEAIKNRKQGISVCFFMVLMKYYRQSYIDLIERYKAEHHHIKKLILFHRVWDPY